MVYIGSRGVRVFHIGLRVFRVYIGSGGLWA